jgi:hypothetical protein
MMFGAQLALEDHQRRLQQLRGLLMAAGGVEDRRERGGVRGRAWVLGAQCRLADGRRPSGGRLASAGRPAAWASPPML